MSRRKASVVLIAAIAAFGLTLGLPVESSAVTDSPSSSSALISAGDGNGCCRN
jgi:hypothetical protein